MRKMALTQWGCLFVMLLVLFSCRKAPEYTRFIPEDAEGVVRIDIRQLIEKSGLGKDQQLKEKFIGAWEREMKPATQEKLKQFMENPEKTGVDWREPLFVFGRSETLKSEGALLAKVQDKSALTDMLNAMVDEQVFPEIQEKDRITYASDGRFVWVHTDDVLLVLYANDKHEDMLHAVARHLEADDEGLHGREGFRKMCESKGDIQIFVDGEWLKEEFLDKPMTKDWLAGMTQDVGMDFDCLSDISFEKGDIRLTTEIFGQTEEASNLLSTANWMGKINDDYFALIPESALAVWALNLDGEQIYNRLIAMDMLKNLNEEEKKTIEVLAGNFQGNVVMVLNGDPFAMFSGGRGVELALYARIKDATVMEDAIENLTAKSGKGTVKNAEGIYAVPFGLWNTDYLYMGVKNKDLFVTNNIGLTRMEKANTPMSVKGIKGSMGYFTLNFKPILDNPAMQAIAGGLKGKEQTGWNVLSCFSKLEVISSEYNKSEIYLRLNNQQQNALELLIDMVKQL